MYVGAIPQLPVLPSGFCWQELEGLGFAHWAVLIRVCCFHGGVSTIDRCGFSRDCCFSTHLTQYTIAPLIHRPQVLPSGDAGTRCPEGEMT